MRRGFAFSSSIKNPPLLKSRNIQSQNSFNASNAPQSVIGVSSSGGSTSTSAASTSSQHQFLPLSIGCPSVGNSANTNAVSPQNLSPDSSIAKSLQQMQMKTILSSQKPIETITNKSSDIIYFETNTQHSNESDV